MKYQRKSRPALWTQTPKAQAQITQRARDKVIRRMERRFKLAVRKSIRRVSHGMSTRRREYKLRAKEWLKGKVCCVYNGAKATEVHHQRGRQGELLMDERFWLPVSFGSHRFIHDNPARAREMDALLLGDDTRKLKLLCAKGDWNKPV